MKTLAIFFLLCASPLQAQTWKWNPVHFDTPVLVLSGADVGAAFYDVQLTQACYPQDCREGNPLAKPFVKYAPAAYASAAGEWYGLSVLAQRMKHSRFKRIWWAPQAAAIGLHLWAARNTNR